MILKNQSHAFNQYIDILGSEGKLDLVTEVNLLTGAGKQIVKGENGKLIVDRENDCLKTTPCTVTAIRLRRDAPDYARDNFHKTWNEIEDKAKVKFLS